MDDTTGLTLQAKVHAHLVAMMLAGEHATEPLFWREVAYQMAKCGFGLRLQDDDELAECQLRVIRLSQPRGA